MSLWRVCNYEDRGKAPYVLPLKEKELVERWFLGKTAIIEGLAQKIVNGNVPSFLKEKVIFSLNVNSLVAGTKYRGELEEKLDILYQRFQNKKGYSKWKQ